MLRSSLFCPGWSICKWRTSDNFYFCCWSKNEVGKVCVRVYGWGVSAVQRSKRTNSVEEGVCHRDKWGSVQWGTPVPVVPAASSDTDNSSDKPQLPRCTVSLSKSRQYCWQFCTLGSLWFCEIRFCETTYLQIHQDNQRTHTCTWEHHRLYLPSKLHFVSHTLTLTPNNAVPGFWLQRNVWCGKFFLQVCIGLAPLRSYDLWRECAWKCEQI